MKVFRLEHAESRDGAYRGKGDEIMYGVWNDRNNSLHPSPEQDSKLVEAMGKVFAERDLSSRWCAVFGKVNYGFETVEQFRRWFYNDEILLEYACAGYVLSVYDVPQAFYGHSQATFPSEYHKDEYLEKEIDLLSLVA